MYRELFQFTADVTDAGFPVTDTVRPADPEFAGIVHVEYGGRFTISATPDGVTFFDVETGESVDVETPWDRAVPEFLEFCHERKH